MTAPDAIYLRGVGLWAPGFEDVRSWYSGRRDACVVLPKCAFTDARSTRGVSRLARMLAEVVTQATPEDRLGAVPTVYASAWGEMETMTELLHQVFEGAAGLSPLRFKHSVHNAAAGLLSVGTQNQSFSTAITAGWATFEQGLLEARMVLREGDEVVLAVGDDVLPPPLDRYGDFDGLAVAFRFGAAPGAHIARLERFRVEDRPHGDLPEKLAGNPSALSLALLDALEAGKSGPISFGRGRGTVADLHVEEALGSLPGA